MHFHAEIYLKNLDNLDEQVGKIMLPYCVGSKIEKYEEDGEEYLITAESFWDWWVIGGRWTGKHTGYNPFKDRLNISICKICNGTGFRDDEIGQKHREQEPTYTCNVCGERDFETKKWSHGEFGPGLRLNSTLRPYHGDVMHIAGIKDDLNCDTFVIKGKVFHEENWDHENDTMVKNPEFDGNVKNKLNELGIEDGYLVTVDYHC
jgi:hypothetical protein